MRIGIITQNTIEGGVDTFLINLVKNYQNHDVTLFYNKNKNLDRINTSLKSKNFKLITYPYLISNNILRLKSRILVKLLNIYLFTFNILLNSVRLSFLFKKYKIEKLLIVNGGYPGGEVCIASVFACLIVKRISRPWLNIHNFPIAINKYGYFRKIYENFLDKMIAKNISGIITVSENCKMEFLNRPSLKYTKVNRIYNGYDKGQFTNNYSLKKKLNLKVIDRLVLFPAVFEKRKGHLVALKAFKEIVKSQDNIHLIICGNGSTKEKNKIQKNIIDMSLQKNVHMLKFIKNIEDLYSQSDLVVVPSTEMESFGYTAIEAMSFELPVIASNIGGLKEIVIDNKNGFLIEPFDHFNFADKICYLINNNKLRVKFGKEAYKYYKINFSSKAMAKNYLQLIKQ